MGLDTASKYVFHSTFKALLLDFNYSNKAINGTFWYTCTFVYFHVHTYTGSK